MIKKKNMRLLETTLAVNGSNFFVLPGIAVRMGGSDTPQTGNWVVNRHTLQTEWGSKLKPQSTTQSGAV